MIYTIMSYIILYVVISYVFMIIYAMTQRRAIDVLLVGTIALAAPITIWYVLFHILVDAVEAIVDNIKDRKRFNDTLHKINNETKE